MKASDWIKIERDKDGFLADKSRDEIYNSLPVIVWYAEGGTEMRTNITKEDVLKLREEFNKYADRAEQHEYPLLALINIKIDETIEHFSEFSMEDLNAMFRVIYNMIGKDKTDYMEV